MALLFVQAVAVHGPAGAGNKAAAFLAVSVVDADGNPKSGLDEHQFLTSVVASPSGTQSPITSRLDDSPQEPGYYLMSVFPREGSVHDRWSAGDYVLAVAVKAALAMGQTVTLLSIPG